MKFEKSKDSHINTNETKEGGRGRKKKGFYEALEKGEVGRNYFTH